MLDISLFLLLSKQSWNILGAIGLATWLALVAVVIHRAYFHPLSKFPGPFFASITNLHKVWRFFQGNEEQYYQNLHIKYGPIVRFGPNSLAINQPKFLPVIYHRRADKTSFYNPNFGVKSSFSTLKHEDYVPIRRRMASAYSMASIKPYEPKIDASISNMLNALKEVDQQNGVELENWMHWFAFDTISAILSGEPMGFIKERKDVRGLIQSFEKAVPFLEIFARIPTLSWLVRITWLGRKLWFPRPGDKSGIGIIMQLRDEWFVKHTQQFRPTKLEDRDLMDRFMAGKYLDGTSLSEYDVKAETLIVMLAGSVTVSEGLSDLYLNLLQHPSCMDKLRAEVDSALQSVSSPAQFDEICKLRYLDACIRESFRLCSSPPLLPRFVAEPGITFDEKFLPPGITFDAKFIPPGVEVASSPWITMRNRDMYGQDSDTYRPERWLEASVEQKREWDTYDFHWGYGNRQCMGKNIATVEIYKVAFELTRHFDLTLSGGTRIVARNRDV